MGRKQCGVKVDMIGQINGTHCIGLGLGANGEYKVNYENVYQRCGREQETWQTESEIAGQGEGVLGGGRNYMERVLLKRNPGMGGSFCRDHPDVTG